MTLRADPLVRREARLRLGLGVHSAFGRTDLSADLSGAPLGDTPLGDTPLADTPLGDTPLGDTPISSVEDCAAIFTVSDCSNLTGTVGDNLTLLQPGATIADAVSYFVSENPITRAGSIATDQGDADVR